uniref:Uncharacterized protein n=1 Tax=Rhizophora mucronata TaxID=61149 RepID=A0A2P2QXS6_RHIMU
MRSTQSIQKLIHIFQIYHKTQPTEVLKCEQTIDSALPIFFFLTVPMSSPNKMNLNPHLTNMKSSSNPMNCSSLC